ncbi:putative ABC transport system permease protein [Roseibium hamelinense]|uniref:Putative ABC transport system permease protein n=1 Tax=Roseibium hamelinense TaxID=150831 RepID=A0A562SU73_9HYPH|nr:ABC transporter permease [Roseibium hamelinense]MTI42534.1 FtsX-like permease family protein [Roseibium hamelinense]TWI84822.1 putative ABC transport system permease protein [Roseibium hamelinense]
MLWDMTKLAHKSIFRNALRSCLTVLGVVIGVASVIAMLTLGQGSSEQVIADVEKMGTNVIVVRPGQRGMGPRANSTAARPFDIKDVDALEEALPEIDAAAPISSLQGTIVAGTENHRAQITATDQRYLVASDWPLALGRNFSASETRSGKPVCILGQTVRQELFGTADPLDQPVRIKKMSCNVIGVLSEKGASSIGADQDDVVLVPLRTYQRRLTGKDDVSVIYMSVIDGTSTGQAIREVENLMRELRRIAPGDEDDFSVIDMKQVASMLTSITGVLTGLLSAVAAVSLLVGGIGIMNIMLVSVTERTREIGIRLAVGAQTHQVLMQFLIEAVALSLLGGLVGIVLGLGLAAIGAHWIDIPFVPNLGVILLAFVFSAIVGAAFGYYPARAAANLDPIEALRHE